MLKLPLALLSGLAALTCFAADDAPRHKYPDVPTTLYTYKTAGGCAVHATVSRAAGDDVRPAVLWIHGGALMLGSRRDLVPAQRQRYIDAGFVIVSIDYRLAPETKLDGIIEDVKDAYRWMRREGPALFKIDPDRIAVVGHSAGGYLTLLSGVHFQPKPKALVAFYGYGDIAGAWTNQPDAFYNRQPPIAREDAYRAVADHPISEEPPRGRGRYYRYCRQQGIWAREVTGADAAKEPRHFDPWCPIRNITRDYPPTLLLHGDSDTDVPVEQSALMYATLKQHGVPCTFIRNPKWGHGFDGGGAVDSDPEISTAFDQAITFLKEHLQPGASH